MDRTVPRTSGVCRANCQSQTHVAILSARAPEVTHASSACNGAFAESDTTRIGEMLQVNIVALTELTRLILPAMIARKRGRVMLFIDDSSAL
jgi:short-subunit dehydrogenase